KNLYPPDIIEQTTEYHLAKNTIRSQVIYLVVVVAFLAGIVSLPFIRVNVSMQSGGIVRPITEKTEVKALVSGRISHIFISNEQEVSKNDTLLSIQSDQLTSKYYFLDKQITETKDFISDLKKLVSLKATHFASTKYQGEYLKFKEQIRQAKNKRNKAEKELNRNKELLEHEFISKKDYDDLVYQHTLSENEYKVTVSNQLSLWKADLTRQKSNLADLKVQLAQLKKEQEHYIVKAPVTGTIEQFIGIYEGSNIQAGQIITSISPETKLIAEVYVSPKDIGYLKKGTKLNIQVDAFNYNDWGMIKGEILDISNDYILMNDQVVFKIRCTLQRTDLHLRNGVKGRIKKGMTIRARFLLAKRSLYQLLFDSVNDWLNPAQNKQS
ncbi:MAG: HlyD family secretion protein, partial [Cytophagales bacterium]|nr:HlyD family secretion protein [Cytophagales bacterium]